MVEITEQEVVDIDRVNASGKLPVTLAIVGHSFGGLLTQANLCRRVGRDRCCLLRSVLSSPISAQRSEAPCWATRRTGGDRYGGRTSSSTAPSRTPSASEAKQLYETLSVPGLDQGSSRGGQVISEFDDNVVRDAEANAPAVGVDGRGRLSERPALFRRSYYVCPNGHWSIADSDAKILPCNLCTQIAERDYEIIERRSRASRAEVGGCAPGMDVPRVGGT
jgi:hypothetical protein